MDSPNVLRSMVLVLSWAGITVGVTVAAFLIFRRIMLWYWRITELVNILKKIEGHLAKTSTVENKPAIK